MIEGVMFWPTVCLLVIALWATIGYHAFYAYLISSFEAKAWVERVMFVLSGPITWWRFHKLWRGR